MTSSFLQSKTFKAIVSLVVAAVAFASMTVFAAWTEPNSSSDTRSTFLNLGPDIQTKTGRLDITSSSPLLASAKFEVEGPAMLAKGINAEGTNATNNLSGLVLGDVYVGYQGAPGATPTANTSTTATYDLYGNVLVSNNIKSQNLAHSGTNELEPVCTTLEGWLVPCTDIPVCGDLSADNFNPNALSPGYTNDPTMCHYTVCCDISANNGTLILSSRADQYTCNNSLCTYDPQHPTDPVGCFIEGTMVQMANGSYKDIKDVEIGESIQSSAGPEIVMKKYVIDYTGYMYKINGSEEYFASDTHPFMTTEGWKSFAPERTRLESPTLEVSQLELGDVLIKENGEKEVLKSFDSIYTSETVYNFGLNGARDFYADGYLVHNVDLFPIAEAAQNCTGKQVCGDGICCGSESYTTCSADCSAPSGGGSTTTPITCADNPCAGGGATYGPEGTSVPYCCPASPPTYYYCRSGTSYQDACNP